MIQIVPYRRTGGREYALKRPIESTIPGIASGAMARNARARAPAISRRWAT